MINGNFTKITLANGGGEEPRQMAISLEHPPKAILQGKTALKTPKEMVTLVAN
jgi:hypothetical protein